MSLINLQRGWYLFVGILAIMHSASWSLIDGHGLEYKLELVWNVCNNVVNDLTSSSCW